MKTLLFAFLLFGLFDYSYSQKINDLEFSYYNYHVHRENNWKWLSLTYSKTVNSNLKVGCGVGYNITPNINNNVIELNPIPKNEKKLNNLNINVAVKRSLSGNYKKIKFFGYYKCNLNRSSLFQTITFQVDSNYYLKNTYTTPKFFMDHTFGLGIEILFSNTSFFLRCGPSFFYSQHKFPDRSWLNLNSEFGFKYQLQTLKKEK